MVKVNAMPKCPNCGSEVNEEMAFCPKCGASLKGEKPRTSGDWGREFGERMGRWGKEFGERMSERARREAREERYEKGARAEKHEKREFEFIGPLVGGLILVFLGLVFYLQVTYGFGMEVAGALFLVVIGVIVLAVGLYTATTVRKRSPKT
jgi:hypothetical protein